MLFLNNSADPWPLERVTRLWRHSNQNWNPECYFLAIWSWGISWSLWTSSYKLGVLLELLASTRNSDGNSASAQQMVVTEVECPPPTRHCTDPKGKLNTTHVGVALLQQFLYQSSRCYKLLSNHGSNHPNLSWDCSLSQHFCKVLWAAGPGVRNWANLLVNVLLISGQTGQA